jgi:hypothetical protein
MRTLWEHWKRFGKRAGDIQGRAIDVLLLRVIKPVCFGVRRWTDPLAIEPDSAKGWRAREDSDLTVAERATRRF